MSQFTMRMDPKFKKETQANFEKMGLSMSAATKMFYTFVNTHGYLPFTPTTGKTKLEQAIEDAENGIYGHVYNSVEDFRKRQIE